MYFIYSDLLESGVDNESEYEEMPSSPSRNNNRNIFIYYADYLSLFKFNT